MRQKETLLPESVDLVQAEKLLMHQTRLSAKGRDGTFIASVVPPSTSLSSPFDACLLDLPDEQHDCLSSDLLNE